MLALLLIVVAVNSIWTKPFSVKWWGGAIFLFLILIVIPNIVDLARSFSFVKRTQGLAKAYKENPDFFESFIDDTQTFWSFGSEMNPLNIPLSSNYFLNYSGPRTGRQAMKALWQDYQWYQKKTSSH
jgi:hypothetical protein